MEVGGTNRALVIGAQGVLGAFMVDAFEAAGWVVRSGARRPRPGQIAIDVGRRDSIAAAMDEHELVVNTVPHPDLLAERHILEHGGALINVSDLPAAAARSLRAVAGGARGTVVMNAGLAPGVTTIVADTCCELHPAASELEIVFTLSLSASRGPESADFIHRGLTAVPRHRTALVPTPEPIRRAPTVWVSARTTPAGSAASPRAGSFVSTSALPSRRCMNDCSRSTARAP